MHKDAGAKRWGPGGYQGNHAKTCEDGQHQLRASCTRQELRQPAVAITTSVEVHDPSCSACLTTAAPLSLCSEANIYHSTVFHRKHQFSGR